MPYPRRLSNIVRDVVDDHAWSIHFVRPDYLIALLRADGRNPSSLCRACSRGNRGKSPEMLNALLDTAEVFPGARLVQ